MSDQKSIIRALFIPSGALGAERFKKYKSALHCALNYRGHVSAVVFLIAVFMVSLPIEMTAEPALAQGTGVEKFPLLDPVVTTEHGERLHFSSELIKGRIAVINFIYTDCTRICPRQAKTFSQLGDALGDRLGRDVILISISLSPETDTPEKLSLWAKAFSPRPGWVFITGSPQDISPLVRRFVPSISVKNGHDATAIVLHEESKTFVYKYGLDSQKSFIETIESINQRSP